MAPVLPPLESWPLLDVVGAELLPVVVPEGAEEGDDEEETKGFESLEIAAAVRSNWNWRMLLSPCWTMFAEVEAEFRAEPWFQAQIHGDVVEVLEEASLHVEPGCC